MSNEPNDFTNSIDQMKGLLSAYIDDELTPVERRMIEQALASSAELRDSLASLSQTIAVVQNLPRVPAPRPFTLTERDVDMIAPAANLQDKHTWFNWNWLRPALGGVIALAMVVVVGTFLFQQNSRQQTVAESMIAQAPLVTETQARADNKVIDTSDEQPMLDSAAQTSALSAAETEVAADEVVMDEAVQDDALPEDIASADDAEDMEETVSAVLEVPFTPTVVFTPSPLPTSTPALQTTLSSQPAPPVLAQSDNDQQRSSFAESSVTSASPEMGMTSQEPPPAPFLANELSLASSTNIYTIEALSIISSSDGIQIQSQIERQADLPNEVPLLRIWADEFCVISAPPQTVSADAMTSDTPANARTDTFDVNLDLTNPVEPGLWYIAVVMGASDLGQTECSDDLILLSNEIELFIDEASEIQLKWRRAD